MQRKQLKQFIDQSNDSSGINSKRGMARKAKRNTSKRIRQALKKDSDHL